jgi:hypothetical protein
LLYDHALFHIYPCCTHRRMTQKKREWKRRSGEIYWRKRWMMFSFWSWNKDTYKMNESTIFKLRHITRECWSGYPDHNWLIISKYSLTTVWEGFVCFLYFKQSAFRLLIELKDEDILIFIEFSLFESINGHIESYLKYEKQFQVFRFVYLWR